MGLWKERGLQTKRSHGAITQSRFTTFLRSEGSPNIREMRNKFRLPLVAVFTTYSFQNYGSLHLVKVAAFQKHAQVQTVDLSTAFCSHGSWSFMASLRPVQKIQTKFLVSPYVSVRSYCLIRPPFLFTFRVALAVWTAIQPEDRFFPPSKMLYYLYRMLILRQYQLRADSSTVVYWPRTQMADCNGYSGREKYALKVLQN